MEVAWGALMCTFVVMFALWSYEAEATHNKLRILVPQRINLIHHHRKTVHYAQDYGYEGKHHFSASCSKRTHGKRRRRPQTHYRRNSSSSGGYAAGLGNWQQRPRVADEDGSSSNSSAKSPRSAEVLGLRSLYYIPEPLNTTQPLPLNHAPAILDPEHIVEHTTARRRPAKQSTRSPDIHTHSEYEHQGDSALPPPRVLNIHPPRDLTSLVVQHFAEQEPYQPFPPQISPQDHDVVTTRDFHAADNTRDSNPYDLGLEHDKDGIFGARTPDGGAHRGPSSKEASVSVYSYSNHGTGRRTRRRHRDRRQHLSVQTDVVEVKTPPTREVADRSEISPEDDGPSPGEATPTNKRPRTDDVYYQAFRAFSYRNGRSSTAATIST